MQEGFTCSQKQNACQKQPEIKSTYLNVEEIQENFRLSSDEEVRDHLYAHQLKQRNKERQLHRMHLGFQAIGSMKPSLFYSNSIEEEYQLPKQAPIVLEKSEQQKKEKRIRRNTHYYQKKIFYQKDSEQEQKYVSPQRKRKMTMEYQSNNNELLMIIPKTSKIQTEYSQFQEIKVKRFGEQPEEIGIKSNQENCIGRLNQKLLFYDDSEDSKESQENSQKTLQRKKGQVSNTLSHSHNQAMIQSYPQLQVMENVLDPSETMKKKQEELSESLFRLEDSVINHSFFKEGIEVGSRVVFEALIDNNNIFARQYSLWLDGGDKKMLLMQGKKYVKITQDYYLINQCCDNQAPFNFLAKLESNFMRKQLLLTNEPENVDSQSKQVYGKFAVCSEVDGKPSIVAAFPAFDRLTHQQKVFNIGSNIDNFKTLLRYRQHQVTSIYSCRLQQSYESHFMARNNLIKTRKTMALIDSNGVIKAYIGKTQSRRYKIYAGSGISPLLIFAAFIVMIES